jgi:transportin-1
LYLVLIFLIQCRQVDPATGEPPDKQIIASSLDLADGLLRGVDANFALLLESCARASGGPQLLQLLPACLRDEDDDVRQAALGLLGDLAVHAPQALVSSGATAGALVGAAGGDAALAAADLVPLLLESLSATVYGRKVASNAAWALGEFAVAFGGAVVEPSCTAACGRLVVILSDDECHPNLLENAAVCIGRLAAACPPQVASCAASLAPVWLPALQHVSAPDDRNQAFGGLVALAQVAWQAPVAGTNYPAFLGAVASWCHYDPPPPELKAQLQAMISAASVELRGTNPESYLGLLEGNYRTHLIEEYTFA